MNLILVESPTKAKTLARFLSKDYIVEATMGHIRDLPKSELGVDVEQDFLPHYIIPRDKKKRVNELAAKAKGASKVILATDPDREGEAIGWHIATLIKEKNKDSEEPTHYDRIVFHEITKTAVMEALENPRKLDMKLVDAQQARRVLDRLVGYKLSPLLWQKLSRRWLSAGRVQSVAVRLVVEREREIVRFSKEPYFTIQGSFESSDIQSGEKTHDQAIVADLVSKNDVRYEEKQTHELFDGSYTVKKTTIRKQEDADAIVLDLVPPYTVTAVDRKEIKRSPPPPFTTSTMQQEAGRKLYYSAKKSMQIAQKLYEEGIITYHRTDSVNLSEKFLDEARSFLVSEYGEKYTAPAVRKYHTKSKVAQEAHEAIRPSDVKIKPDSITENDAFNRDHVRLYELIWKRAVSSQAADAIFDSTTIAITSLNSYRFETQGSVVKFDGFMKIQGRETDELLLPKVTVGESLKLKGAVSVPHETQPPPRYTEASLVKTLEEKDIGRPSTYAPIISTIIDRNYIVKEEKKLLPTELGMAVTDFLVKHFPEILNLPFTATMEDSLDGVANGEKEWVPVIRDFYGVFSKTLEDTYKSAEKVKMEVKETGEPCPECSSPLVFRMGRFGKFIACSTFPKCKYTRQFTEKIDIQCPKCGGDIVMKKSRRGKSFYGCSNYPTCTFAAWKKEDIK
jgi:DNA topoisomerase I